MVPILRSLNSIRCRWRSIRVIPTITRLQGLKRPFLQAEAGVVVALPAILSSSPSSTLHSTKNTIKMAEFAGKYKLISSENFDEYMKAVGVGLVTRKMANAATPVQDVEVNGDEYYIKTSTTFKTTEIRFKLGVEFDETTADGRAVKTTVTKEGNKLIQTQKGEKGSIITREFEGDQMKMVLTYGDVVCTRIYKKE